MRAIEIVREELQRRQLAFALPIERRRELVSLAKTAAKRGSNPRAEVSRALNNTSNKG